MDFNLFCEHLICWSYDSGIFYISGRDIACFIAGLDLGIIFLILSHGRRKKNV